MYNFLFIVPIQINITLLNNPHSLPFINLSHKNYSCFDNFRMKVRIRADIKKGGVSRPKNKTNLVVVARNCIKIVTSFNGHSLSIDYSSMFGKKRK